VAIPARKDPALSGNPELRFRLLRPARRRPSATRRRRRCSRAGRLARADRGGRGGGALAAACRL
jgi:hypothetical protein